MADEIVMYGILGIAVMVAAAVLVLAGIFLLLAAEVRALAAGDTGFVLSSAAACVAAIGLYTGAGLWLRKTGRI